MGINQWGKQLQTKGHCPRGASIPVEVYLEKNSDSLRGQVSFSPFHNSLYYPVVLEFLFLI